MAQINPYPSLGRSDEARATPAVLVPVDVAADRLTDHFWPAADYGEAKRAAMRGRYRRVMEGAGPAEVAADA